MLTLCIFVLVRTLLCDWFDAIMLGWSLVFVYFCLSEMKIYFLSVYVKGFGGRES